MQTKEDKLGNKTGFKRRKAKRERITRKKDQNRFAKRKERKTNPIFGCMREIKQKKNSC